MPFGICPLSVIAVRESADENSRMVTQLLYGELFRLIDYRKYWSKIRIPGEKREGWIKKDQFQKLSDADY